MIHQRFRTAITPYLQLMRVDKPIGIWLLVLPCWQSLALAAAFEGWSVQAVWLFVLFAVGAFIMRGAGCAYNDWVDHDIDRQVARTRTRPIASGAVSRRQATILILILCLIGFGILIQMNTKTILLGIASLVLIAIYPWAKRFTWWPQVFLGLAINWGALMGWVAYTGEFNWRSLALYASGIFWTLGYDTIYAHQDREDDALIGVKSSARHLGEHTKPALVAFYGLTVLLAGAAGYGLNWPFWIGLAGYAGCLSWQVYKLNIDDAQTCLSLFRFNSESGLVLLVGILGAIL